MNQLLSANLVSLFKNKVFWICSIFMTVLGIYLPIFHYCDMNQSGNDISMDRGFFCYPVFVLILMAVFISIYIGTEYSDGTMRNKLIVGHSRCKVYLANLLVCIVAGCIICTCFLLPYLVIGIPLLGGFEAGTKEVILLILATYVLVPAVASIFTMVSMINQNKAIIAVICILLAFVFLMSAAYINSALNEPKIYDSYSYVDQSGKLVQEGAEPNPNYLAGTKRDVYQFIVDVTPGGQALQIDQMDIKHPEKLMLYSVLLAVICSGIGIIVFKRKDLK